ncbi:MAG: AgmX/PglI C-terminal domain-containing protein [Sandaracinaceae bacterium]
MTHTTLTCVLLVSVIGCGQPAEPEPDPLAQGWHAAQAGDHERAATHYARASAAQPQEPAAWLGSAREALRNAQPAEARDAATRAVELVPESADAHELLGRALLALPGADAPEEEGEATAQAELARALELAPERSRLHFPLARALERAGDPDAAIEAYRAAAEAGAQPARSLVAAARTRLDTFGGRRVPEDVLAELEQELDRAEALAAEDQAAQGAIRGLRRRIERKRAPALLLGTMGDREGRAAMDHRIAENAGLLVALSAGRDSSLSDVFGHGNPGLGASDILGGLTGAPVGDASGLGADLSQRHGAGGTGAATGLGGLGSLDRAGPPRDLGEVRQAQPRVTGALAAATVQPVLRRLLSAVRYCYQRERARESDLAGRLAVTLDVSPAGVTERARAVDNTIGSTVASCVTRVVRRARFPSASETSTVEVSYTFE